MSIKVGGTLTKKESLLGSKERSRLVNPSIRKDSSFDSSSKRGFSSANFINCRSWRGRTKSILCPLDLDITYCVNRGGTQLFGMPSEQGACYLLTGGPFVL